MALIFDDTVLQESEAYLYWIRSVNHKDMDTEGYIGVSTNPRNRWLKHRSALKGTHKNKQSYCEDFYKAFKEQDLFMSVVDCGSLDEMLWKEFLLRPSLNVGWNVAVGGTLNGVCATVKHGYSKTPHFQRYYNFLEDCKDKGLHIDHNFKEEQGLKLFVLHLKDNSTEGVRFKTVKLINEDLGFIAGNYELVDGSPHSDSANWLFYDNRWWSKKEACAFNGVNIKTADKRLTKYGMSRKEAVGFEAFLQRNYKIVLLDNVECKLNTALSNFDEVGLKEMYEFYKSGQRGFKAFCKQRGVESSNMIRYFERYGLKAKVDNRKKGFKGVSTDDQS